MAEENPAKRLLESAKAEATAGAAATATTGASEAAWVSTESAGSLGAGVGGGLLIGFPGGRGRAQLDGLDAALYDETTRVLVACGIVPEETTRRMRNAVHAALRMRSEQARCCVGDAGLLAVKRWQEYRDAAALLRYTVGARKFFVEGDWLNPNAWPWDQRALEMRKRATAGMFPGVVRGSLE